MSDYTEGYEAGLKQGYEAGWYAGNHEAILKIIKLEGELYDSSTNQEQYLARFMDTFHSVSSSQNEKVSEEEGVKA